MLVTFIIIFLLLSALFSGTEIAFISASKLRVELKRKKGSRRGVILADFYEKPAEFLGTMLIGNNIVLVVFTYLMTKFLSVYFEAFQFSEPVLLFINTVLITIVVLIFGEFLPKTLFRLFADRILYFLAYPLLFFKYLLQIPSWIMIKLSNLILKKVFKASVENVDQAFTRLELENFIKGTQTKSEKEIDTNLFEKALYLRKVKVKECMVPRPEIVDIDIDASIKELKQIILDTNMSRILVSDGDVENIMGYVHHQQLLSKPKSIKQMMMPISFVPEAMPVHILLNKFIKNSINIACVVDEYGGVAGIITMEDIVEEIFGEIEDEHDQEDYIEKQISENEFLFSGRLEVDYLNEKYEQINFPKGDYHTLSGYLVMTIENIPEQFSAIELDGYKFIFELVSETKIETLRVIKLENENKEVD
ncbi:MAG TPA: HlyC/CorC family transporter [Saprospiraceae bacterium]|nr:HlyC/CorC family transporter [Saprospiraceae bacterium]